jgi:HK97 family phage major capsid protein
LVRFDMARAAALKADLAMLEGTGGTQIKGLLTYTGLGSHTATTTGANGDTFQPQDVALMEATLPDAVDAPTAWLMRKAMYAALMNRRADAVSAADGKGAFLFRGSSAASNAPPADLYGTRVVRSSQVSGTRTKGSGTDLSYVLLGYFPDWIVARMGVMEFLASGHGDTAITNDQTVLRGIQHVDAGPRHPASFVLCDQLIVELNSSCVGVGKNGLGLPDTDTATPSPWRKPCPPRFTTSRRTPPSACRSPRATTRPTPPATRSTSSPRTETRSPFWWSGS